MEFKQYQIYAKDEDLQKALVEWLTDFGNLIKENEINCWFWRTKPEYNSEIDFDTKTRIHSIYARIAIQTEEKAA